MGGRGASVSCSEPPPLDPSFKLSEAMSKQNRTQKRRRVSRILERARPRHAHFRRSSSTLAKVSKGVVALLGEGDLVDGVS